jgi:hypothetical protein
VVENVVVLGNVDVEVENVGVVAKKGRNKLANKTKR